MQACLSYIRLTLVVAWIVVLGLLVAYPRFQPISDLPEVYSSLRSQVLRNRSEYDDIVTKGRINLMVRQLNGTAKPGDTTAEDRVLKDRAFLAQQMRDSRIRAQVSFKTADPIDSKAVLGSIGSMGVVRLTGTPSDAVSRRQRIDRALHLGQAELKRLTEAGKVKPEAAAQWLWLAKLASAAGREWELVALVKALQDPAAPRAAALERLNSKVSVIIESNRGDRISGYLVDQKSSVVMPFHLGTGALPETITAELRKWTIAHSLWFRIVCVASAVFAAMLIPIERYLTNREPRYTSEVTPDVRTDYARALRLRRDMARIRKGLDASGTQSADTGTDWRVGVLERLLSPETVWTLAVSAALVFVVGLYAVANPKAPGRDRRLRALITQQVEREEFTVVRYW